MKDTIPYGEWPSSFAEDLLGSRECTFGGLDVDGDVVYWLECRSAGNRRKIRRVDPDGTIVDVTPEEVDIGTRVYEFGGGAFAVEDGVVVCSRSDDQRLYQIGHNDIEPLTPEKKESETYRYADIDITPNANWVYCVRQRCKDGDRENELVAVPLDSHESSTVVAGTAEFYASPRVSPDGNRLTWLTWHQSKMPWDGTRLHVADIESGGAITNERSVLGGDEESVIHPVWGPNGTLYAVSDRSGWWNVYALSEGQVTPVKNEEAEYGTPTWNLGLSTISAIDDGKIAAIKNRDGRQTLGILDVYSGSFQSAGLRYDAYPRPRIAASETTIATVAGSPTDPPSLIRWDRNRDDGSDEISVLRRSFGVPTDRETVVRRPPSDPISEPIHLQFPTGRDGQQMAYAHYYPPKNPSVTAPAENPPVIINAHGGPAGQALPVLSPEIQYFTSRGIGFVDLNYRGSTGYGRDYREELYASWGITDARDCANVASHIVELGWADPDRLVVRGKSAGGFTALSALIRHEAFDAGVNYYGVTDLQKLREHLHPFEAHYIDALVGSQSLCGKSYEKRSPIERAEDIDTPLLLLQGSEDPLVPPSQSKSLVETLSEGDVFSSYVELPGEGHGFHTAEALKRALREELTFYSNVFDIDAKLRADHS